MSWMMPIPCRGQQGRIHQNFNQNIEPPITRRSVVVISAAEAKVAPGIFDAEDGADLHLGEADVRVTNVPPHPGEVECILHAKWGALWT